VFECEKRCVIEKKTNPNEFLEEQRNAFNCRRDNRQMCEKKQCHLGYHCFVETKEKWREDIGHLFGRGLCRIGASNKAECDKKKHEHLEFENTVTKGFLGDKSFFYAMKGNGGGRAIWNSILRFLDGGLDKAGLVGRGGKANEEKMDLFCKTFKGEVKALKKNAQTVGFQLPALTYEKLKKSLTKEW
jgi:hypothetical protein